MGRAFKEPATLIKLEWPAQPLGAPALTLHLSDKPGININGTEWFHLVESPGSLNNIVDSANGGSGSDGNVSISVINHPTDLFSPPKSFSHIFREYRLEAGKATICQWFENEGMAVEDLTPMLIGRLTDPISYDENLCSFNVVDVATDYGDKKTGALVNASDYPLAPESSIGKMKPIVIGAVPSVPAIPLRKAQETRVKSVVLSGGSLIDAMDTTGFPESGTIIINDDEIAYSSKNATQFLGCTGINEFHYADDVILEKVSGHRYLLSDPAYPIQSIASVKAGGHLADAGDYTIDLAKAEVIFTDKPKKTDSIDTKFLQAQMDAVASGNNATDPGNAFIPNSPATYAKLSQGATPLALKQTDDMANIGEIASVLVRVEHFMEEKLSSDTLTVEIPGIGSLGQLPPPSVDDVAVVTGDVDITHDTLIGTLDFPVTDPQHEHALPQKTTFTQLAVGGIDAENSFSLANGNSHPITFPALPAGTIEKGEYSFNIHGPTGWSTTNTSMEAHIGKTANTNSHKYFSNLLDGSPSVYTLYGTINDYTGTTVYLHTNATTTAIGITVRSAVRIITMTPVEDVATKSTGVTTNSTGSLAQTTGNPALNATSEKATKTVVKHFDITGNVNGDWGWFKDKEIHVKYNGTSDGRTAFIIHTAFEIEYARRRVSFTDEITADVNGVIDDTGGSVTGTPSALIERPDHIYKWSVLKGLQKTASEVDSVSFTNAGSFYSAQAGGYKLAGIVQNQTAWRELWREWGRSCRSPFYWDLGEAKILIRPLNRVDTTATFDKAIDPDDVRLDSNSRLMFKTERGASRNIINSIDIKYSKDWSGGNDEPYSAIESISDADSILRYDKREDESRFRFDWVRGQAMASDLAEFYLEEHAEPLDVYDFELFLPYMDLERGDIIRMNPPSNDMGNLLCIILGVGRVFGSGKEGRMDSIQVKARTMRGTYLLKDGYGFTDFGSDFGDPSGFGLSAFGQTGFGGVVRV